MDNGHEDEAGDKEENVEALKQKVRELENTLMDHWEYNTQSEGGHAPILKVPVKPTDAEWKQHMVTHTPPRPWCRFCIMGRGVRRQHKANVPDVEDAENGPVKLSMDYM